jgi:hypothetical protein
MAKQLTVHNATVTTAAVEVKTLTISGKQVTLAVFRQLREEQLLAGDGNFLGEAWGYVNYHPDKCEGDPQHLHVVWQRGSDLLRARVNAPWSAGLEHPAAASYAEALIAEGATVGFPLPVGLSIRGSNSLHKSGSTRLTYKGVEFVGTVRAAFAETYQTGGSREQLEQLEQMMFEEHGADWCSDAYLDRLPVAGYQRAWRVLNELPQLFIAV